MRTGTLTILMYHAVGAPGEPAERFVVPVRTFERQLRWLALARFSVVRLEEAVASLVAGRPLPPRSVALTFDDGTRDLLTAAYRVLERFRFPATAFVVTGAMGGNVDWTDAPGLAGRPLMSWTDASALRPLVTLQPHTRTHPQLPALDDARLRDEIAGSRDDLERRTGRSSDVFAYPYGKYDARIADATARAGFTAACSVRPGANDSTTPAFELRRHEVRGEHGLRRFVAMTAAPHRIR